MKILLASSSPYRKLQLENLGLQFDQASPLFDEESLKNTGLAPQELVQLLAVKKAESLKTQYPDHIIIGSDQLLEFKGKIYGKPGSPDKALEQLRLLSGKTHSLMTSICALYKNEVKIHTDITQLQLKPLNKTQIHKYIELDNPLDCAGSYKIESKGLLLMQSIQSEDFSSIQGLPILKLFSFLDEFNYDYWNIVRPEE
ncbi:MAG: septum formation protein Maf [Bdellovibrionales bacterium]|nr:septum formation protein Maf [Bdellovibrionales bacterium]